MKTQLKHKPLLLLAVVGIALVGYGISMKPLGVSGLIAKHKTKTTYGVSEKELSGIDQRLQVLGPDRELRQIRDAYLDMRLDETKAINNRALAELAIGLNSSDDTLRKTTGMYVGNLLVVVTYGTKNILPEYKASLDQLFRLYKTRCPERIRIDEKAFPQSPTLAYLNQIESVL